MKSNRFLQTALLCGASVLAIGAAPAFGQQPDNTGTNKGQSTTADQQSNTAADRDLAKKIRQSIMDDNTLSTYAHNVKVIVRNGEVTLKGPVKSEDEKTAVESKATTIAGADKVQNKLMVKSSAQ
jgi:hyperosmotically inducible periplasmic protein